MKRWIALLSVSCLAALGWAQSVGPVLKPLTVIRAGTLIDGVSNSARRDQVIVVRGNVIAEVSDAA